MRIGVDASAIMRISGQLVTALVGPPRNTENICDVCCTWAPRGSHGERQCENCQEVAEVLGVHPLACSLVSLYRKPSELRDWLTRYKGRDDEVDPLDPACVDIVRALIGRFIVEHGIELEERHGPFDAMVVVPSTSRDGRHPLASVLDSLAIDVPVVDLLERGSGELGFRLPSKGGFRVTSDIPSQRVLLVDDVYTTGSRLNSAAFALTAAGHQVKGSFVIARRVNPDYSPELNAFWDSATLDRFDWKASPWIPSQK